jgi:hypothetical protein
MRWKPLVEAFGQDVDEEAADELTGGKRHSLVSRAAVGAVILVPEGDAIFVERDQPAVGDGDAVGVARQIGEHRLGAAERGLCLDISGDPAQWRQVGGESLAVGEVSMLAEECEACRPCGRR